MTDIQTAGSLIAFGAFGCATAAPRLLEVCPGCAVAWYLNLEVFHIFEPLRLRASPFEAVFGTYGLAIVAGLMLGAVAAHAWRARMVVAFLANLGFACVLTLLYCRFEGPAGIDAALVPYHPPSVIEAVFGAVLLATSLAAFLVSHAAFVIEVARECAQFHRALSGSGDRFAGPVLPAPAG